MGNDFLFAVPEVKFNYDITLCESVVVRVVLNCAQRHSLREENISRLLSYQPRHKTMGQMFARPLGNAVG
jgi:hypothetical protein